MLTRCLLLAITCDGANDRVLLAHDTVGRALDVSFRLRSVVFGLARGMLLPSGIRPRRRAGQVADLHSQTWKSAAARGSEGG